MENPTAESCLKKIGVYGYEQVEPIILAALVTEDPLLLIGKAGTGKTYLLNSLSEILGFEHRHYNASLINFDELVGFPYPNDDFTGIRYLQTPATVWQAESVLVDEISRCKPEHQNRLFSLIHERRIQGISIPLLRYRWAAMNPCNADQGAGDFYEGSLPLDQALADRFAFVIHVPDWDVLCESDQCLISDPRGEGVRSEEDGAIAERVEAAKSCYQKLLKVFPRAFRDYAMTCANLLNGANIRLSPRRVRQLSKNLLAVTAVNGGEIDERLFLLTLTATIPHAAWGQEPDESVVRSVHRSAWEASMARGREKWLNAFLLERKLSKRVCKLLADCPDADTGTLAVTRSLASLALEEQAAFAFALYPVSLEMEGLVGKEGINDLGKIASGILAVVGELSWQERRVGQPMDHPELSRVSKTLANLSGKRRERASQLFYHLLTNHITLQNPDAYEEEFNQCISVIRSWLKAQGSPQG